MSKTTVRVDTRGIDALRTRLPARARDVVMQTAALIEGDAKVLAPVDTGFLRNSITHQQTGPAAARVNVGAEYGLILEMGSSQQAPNGYLVPAVEKNRQPFYDALAGIV